MRPRLNAVTSVADGMKAFISGPLSGFSVDRADGQLRERIIGLLFLGERFVEKLDGVLMAELAGPSFQRAVPRNFIMFDRLRSCQQTGVERRCVGILVHY